MTHDRNERIRQRAYDIWEREGRPEGKHDEHWRRAASEIDEEDRGAGSALSEAARNMKDYAARVVTAGLTAAADVVEEAMKPKRTRRKAEETATTKRTAGKRSATRRAAGPAPEQVESPTPEAEIETATLAVAPEPPKSRTRRKTTAEAPAKKEAKPERQPRARGTRAKESTGQTR